MTTFSYPNDDALVKEANRLGIHGGPPLAAFIDGAHFAKLDSTDRWVQGYVCAVCALIQMDGQVETPTLELFRSGVGKNTIKQLKSMGVDDFDLKILRKHWKELSIK